MLSLTARENRSRVRGALANPRAVSLKMKPLTATARVEKIDQNLKQPFLSKNDQKRPNNLTATARDFVNLKPHCSQKTQRPLTGLTVFKISSFTPV